jgi:hypothetical protein
MVSSGAVTHRRSNHLPAKPAKTIITSVPTNTPTNKEVAELRMVSDDALVAAKAASKRVKLVRTASKSFLRGPPQ